MAVMRASVRCLCPHPRPERIVRAAPPGATDAWAASFYLGRTATSSARVVGCLYHEGVAGLATSDLRVGTHIRVGWFVSDFASGRREVRQNCGRQLDRTHGMKVVYFGESLCSFETLQRLVLIADEIAFLDRPSVAFGNWGTVGEQSPARQFEVPSDSPVGIHVFSPPWGPSEHYYQRYVEADLANPSWSCPA
jgi:hypothetical protein